MKLYLLRHATAVDVAASDAARALTKEGEEEARIAGEAMTKLRAIPTHIFSSPLVRARQTAQIAARAMGFAGEVETLEELRNDTGTAELLRALKRAGAGPDILLVGHMPSLADHLAGLIGAGEPVGLGFGKGSVACVKMPELQPGCGQLQWFMRQKQLREFAK